MSDETTYEAARDERLNDVASRSLKRRVAERAAMLREPREGFEEGWP